MLKDKESQEKYQKPEFYSRTLTLYSLFPIEVKWCKNGKELSESNRFKIISSASGEYALEIPTVLSTDDGEYQAIASNSNGETLAAFSLNVDFDEDDSKNIDVSQILKKI